MNMEEKESKREKNKETYSHRGISQNDESHTHTRRLRDDLVLTTITTKTISLSSFFHPSLPLPPGKGGWGVNYSPSIANHPMRSPPPPSPFSLFFPPFPPTKTKPNKEVKATHTPKSGNLLPSFHPLTHSSCPTVLSPFKSKSANTPRVTSSFFSADTPRDDSSSRPYVRRISSGVHAPEES